MKKLVVVGCAALALCAANAGTDAGASLTVNQVRQRYPWNGLVDIDYTIECAEGAFGVDDNLEVLMIDNSVTPAVTNRAITFLQAPLPMTPGKHRITWDANADGVKKYVENATFSVEIRHYNDTYMVIDVSGGPDASVYPVKFLNAAPVGGFNKEEYKGSNIVLRCIHPGSYMAGSPDNEEGHSTTAVREKQHRVALSQPFYIGIFEITQEQYLNVMGGTNPAKHQGEQWRYRPVEYVTYNTIRGTANTSNPNHTYDWPWNGDVAPGSFMGLLRAKCKSKDANGNYAVDVEGFDLPTEFQWEYACRAGTTGAFNTTNEYANTTAGQEAVLKLLGRYSGNNTDEHGNAGAHTVVGSYLPNQWGLYDMHGNVCEWCRDWYQGDVSELKQFTDPQGAASASYRVSRSSSWGAAVRICRAAYRDGGSSSTPYEVCGFRLSRTLP